MLLNSTTQTRCLISARLIFLVGIFTKGYCRKRWMSFVIFIITGDHLTVVMESERRIEIMVISINVRELFLFFCSRGWIAFLGNVWHGTQEPWYNWDILSGRFVSEFGMSDNFAPSFLSISRWWYAPHRQAFPNIRTVDYWLGGNKTERFPQSRFVSEASKNAKGCWYFI